MRPRVKEDTVEYNTENFRLRMNANVEELLTQLPGLHIDPDGTIKYNGDKIQHLLVDGEDIFGSDPTMVTRNFDGSKIAKVQMLERKTDQALFTGIDDGTRIKTLNLVLKGNARNGYFGKVAAGGNMNGFYNANAALASFRDKEQFTALGLMSNTGVTKFSSNTGGSVNSVTFHDNNSDPLGASAGTGIPRFEGIALHYANVWQDAVNHFSGNYQFSNYYSQPVTATQILEAQPEGILRQSQQSHSSNQQQQNWTYGTYERNLTSHSAIRLVFYGTVSQSQNQFDATTTSAIDSLLVNIGHRSILDKISKQNDGVNVDWRIQLGKKHNRLFSVSSGLAKIDASTDGYLYSDNEFYIPGGVLKSVDTVHQRKIFSSHSTSTFVTLGYTQEIWSGAVIGMSYSIRYAVDHPEQYTFDRGDGKYNDIIDSLSENANENTVNQLAILNLHGNAGHLNFTIGNEWREYSYRQQELLVDSFVKLHDSRLAPFILLSFPASETTRLSFKYESSFQQPMSQQLLAIKNNSDPLHITVGNPDLKPGVSNSFRFDFYQARNWIFDVSANLTLNKDAISNKTTTDSLGRQIIQPVNVNGGRMIGLNFSVNRKIGSLGIGFHSTNVYSQTICYVNTDLSRNNIYTVGGGFDMNIYMQDKYSLQFTTDFIYLDQKSSVNAAYSAQYWTQNHSGSVTVFLFPGFEFNTNATFNWQGKVGAFTGTTCALFWNAFMSKKFLTGRLETKLEVNNIFDTKAGISRTNTGNTNAQSNTNILGRYWMFSGTWHFDRKFKKSPPL